MTDLIAALGASFEPVNLVLLIAGATIGILFGIIPGIQNVAALSILLPFTYAMAPTQAFILMTAIYSAGVFGGAITAILYRIPGAPENAATTFDGYPLAVKGRAAEALGTTILCSALGGLFSTIILIVAAPKVAPIALLFGPTEYFGLVFFALCLVSMMGDYKLKSMISALLGLLFSTVGLGKVSGEPRFTFGYDLLLGGFDFVVLIVGMFAIAEVLARAEREAKGIAQFKDEKRRMWARLPPLGELIGLGSTVFRCSLLGTCVGILPALGATVAGFFGYDMERRISKNPAQFGTGILRGVAAPETANNASVGGAMIPLLTLGIPGSGSTAVMLGAFMIYGLTPGETLFREQQTLVYLIFSTMILTNFLIVIGGVFSIPLFARLVKLPFAFMAPVIIVLCTIGTYTVRYNIVDVWSMFGFGVFGYVLERYRFSIPVFVLAFILGKIGESAFLRSMIMFDNQAWLLFSRPISGVLISLGLLVLIWSFGHWVYRSVQRGLANFKRQEES
jgi:putative tricarboxylic transport membrane protein